VKLIEANDVRLLSAKEEVRQARIGSTLSKASSDLLMPVQPRAYPASAG